VKTVTFRNFLLILQDKGLLKWVITCDDFWVPQ